MLNTTRLYKEDIVSLEKKEAVMAAHGAAMRKAAIKAPTDSEVLVQA